MHRWARMTVWSGVLVGAALLASACDRTQNPAGVKQVGPPNLWEGYIPATDRITGGGKLGDGHDFATFGFTTRPGQGQIEWVQHCLDGVNPNSPTCQWGQFSFHGSTVDEYYEHPDDPDHCRVWTGSGELNMRDPSMQYLDGTYQYTVDKACDYGEPGVGHDYMSMSIGDYYRGDVLRGGNIQLHKANP
jgi:hypothetical protein